MIKRIIIVGVILLVVVGGGLFYYKDGLRTKDPSQGDVANSGIQVIDYRDYVGDPSGRRNELRSIADTLYLMCGKDCRGYSDDYAIAYSLYGQQLSSDYNDFDYERLNTGNLNAANGQLRIMSAEHCYFLNTPFVKCFNIEFVFNPNVSYVYVENLVALVGADEFANYYLPVFGKMKMYTAIPSNYKRVIIDYLKKNDLVSAYYLSPNPLRAENVIAYGNFAHVGNNSNDPRSDGMVAVLDERNGQSSRLVVFARTLTNEKFMAYDEHFNFPITLQKITSYDQIYKNTEELVYAEGDGVVLKYSSELSRVLYFEDKLQRFVWYDQKPKSEIEEEQGDEEGEHD